MSPREVALGILRLFLLVGRLHHLENLICKTLESVAVSSLVLSLGVKNANAIKEAFEIARPVLVLLMMMRPLYCVDITVLFSLLIVAIGWARLIQVAQILLLLSCVEGHLLGQGVSIGDGKHLLRRPRVFHGKLSDQGRVPESLLKNITIDLSPTSRITFLLLQKRWMYSRRDSPFFWTKLARSQLTPGHAHVEWKLLVNNWCRWFQHQTDPAGNPWSQVLADDDKQTGK
jgi:hypothetical protein